MKRLGLLILGVSLFTTIFAQTIVTEKADDAFKTGKFYDAIDLYKYAFAKAKDPNTKGYINFQVAMCYRNISEFRQAELWFRKVTRRNPYSPLAFLYLADALHANEKFDDALENYKKYIELDPTDPKGQVGYKASALAKEWTDNPTRYKVVPMFYFNSKDSDFSVAYGKDNYKSILFTSARNDVTGGKENPVTGQNYTDIFTSTIDRKGQWSKPVPVEGEVNTDYDEGAPCTNAKANTMWFTSVRPNEKGILTTQIYVSKKQGINWGKPERVTLFESDTIPVGHPAISPDEKTLYFVSSYFGGEGGRDIWCSINEGGKWGKPKNMGKEINTFGDELFPYVHADGTLYFSSTGHQGMGGLDLFSAKKVDNKWEIKNLQYPLNSVRDDFGIVFEGEKERGYLSSNRKGSRGKDDIYQFSLPPVEVKLNLIVKSERSNDGISDASVNIIGSDGTNETKATEQNGSLLLNLNPNTDYRIITRKGGFLAGRGKLTTYGLNESKTIEEIVLMSPNDAPRLVNVMYDFGKFELRPESMSALEELVEILRDDNPNITIELSAHTDARGSADFNKQLSQKRAQSVVDFLILYGIDAERLTAVGYGKDQPKLVTPREAQEFQTRPGYDFLKSGVLLSETYIQSLPLEEMRETAHSLNRRTEFRVTGTDYVPRIRKRK
ncbi:MAG: OmpA family protein [Salinivirgaceae bacterium]|nr:OmpA family protein [Salinivirgaceae bacterium]